MRRTFSRVRTQPVLTTSYRFTIMRKPTNFWGRRCRSNSRRCCSRSGRSAFCATPRTPARVAAADNDLIPGWKPVGPIDLCGGKRDPEVEFKTRQSAKLRIGPRAHRPHARCRLPHPAKLAVQRLPRNRRPLLPSHPTPSRHGPHRLPAATPSVASESNVALFST